MTNYRNESGYTKVTKAMLKAQRERREAEKAVSSAAAARKMEAKQETVKLTSSSDAPITPQAIPTYGMKAGQHYKVGRFQGGRSPGSPANIPTKSNDSQNNSEQQLTGSKPSLRVTATPR